MKHLAEGSHERVVSSGKGCNGAVDEEGAIDLTFSSCYVLGDD
jgi:hypothetical protein